MVNNVSSFKQFKLAIRDFTKSTDETILDRLGIEKKDEKQKIEEAYLPQNLIEKSLKTHKLIVCENLNFKEIYKILVQLLGMKNQSDFQTCETICSFCSNLGFKSFMNYNELQLQYVCNTCNNVKYISNDFTISSNAESNKVFSSRWTTTLKNWVKYIHNGLGEDENINSGQELIKKFSKNKNRINSMHNLIAAVLLIVERSTILEDGRVGPIEVNYCEDCGEALHKNMIHHCIMSDDY